MRLVQSREGEPTDQHPLHVNEEGSLARQFDHAQANVVAVKLVARGLRHPSPYSRHLRSAIENELLAERQHAAPRHSRQAAQAVDIRNSGGRPSARESRNRYTLVLIRGVIIRVFLSMAAL